MARRSQSPVQVAHHVLAALAAAVGITIVMIVAINLDTGDGCLLSDYSSGLCNYAYVAVGVTFVAAAFVSLMQCTASRLFRCGMGPTWADVLLSLLLCIWWSLAAGVISVGVGKAQGKDLPEENWRTATLVLFWVEFLIFLLLAAVGAARNGMRGLVTAGGEAPRAGEKAVPLAPVPIAAPAVAPAPVAAAPVVGVADKV